MALMCEAGVWILEASISVYESKRKGWLVTDLWAIRTRGPKRGDTG